MPRSRSQRWCMCTSHLQLKVEELQLLRRGEPSLSLGRHVEWWHLVLGNVINEISWIMYRNELANWILDLDEFFVIACRLWSLNSEGKTTFSWLERKRHDKILRFTDPKSPDSPVQNPEFKAKLPYCACDFGIRTWYFGISPPMFGCYTLSRQRFSMIFPIWGVGEYHLFHRSGCLESCGRAIGPLELGLLHWWYRADCGCRRHWQRGRDAYLLWGASWRCLVSVDHAMVKFLRLW